ncbi:MAG TPA: ATP-binding protein [Gemmatimonadaceae bacterium]
MADQQRAGRGDDGRREVRGDHRVAVPPGTSGLDTVVVEADDRPLPGWATGLRARALPAATLANGAAEGALAGAGCVLLEADHPRFVTLARRIHALDPSLQVVVVARPSEVQAARKALLYAPGLGEVWIASPAEVSAALAERATGVTRQRRRYHRTRERMEHERLTASPQRAERALISDAYLAGLLRVLPDPVFSVDDMGRVLSANAAADEAFGGPGRPMTGARLPELLGLDRHEADDTLLLQRASRDEPVSVHFRRASGQPGRGELRASRMTGGIAGWAVVLRDVTEQQATYERLQETAMELEASNEELQQATEALMLRTEEAEQAALALRESEATYRALADAIPTLAWTARADGYIDWYNQRWYEYTGTTPAQMEGWGWQSVHDPAMVDAVVARWRESIETGAPFEMTFPLRGADGSHRAFLTRVVPLRDGEGRIVRWFGTNTDVQALRDAQRRADEANRAKSQFLATMSHELRTPLNAIAGHVGLVLEEIYGPLTQRQRTALDRVLRAQQHLLGLINDVLSFARVEGGRLEYHVEAVTIAEIVDSVLPLVEPQLARRKLDFRVELPATRGEPPLVVDADRDKLAQVLVNLLSNAIKFTEPGGRIEIVATGPHDGASPVPEAAVTTCDAGRCAQLTVRDTGIGIPADMLEQVFEPFVQVRGELTRTREGTGLGLAISRDLARGMGGDLVVASTPGEGSAFTILLPLAAGA